MAIEASKMKGVVSMVKRKDAAEKDTWRLEDMVADDGTWERLFREASEKVSGFEKYKERLKESPDTLYCCQKI